MGWLETIVHESFITQQKNGGFIIPVIGPQLNPNLPAKIPQLEEIFELEGNTKFPRLFVLHGKTMNFKEYPKALTSAEDFPDELLFAWSSGSLIELELEFY